MFAFLKTFGELGIINTKLLNEALILKWVWRLHNMDEGNFCCQLIRAKYFLNKHIARCKGKEGVPIQDGGEQD
jgi:hypothetical protein